MAKLPRKKISERGNRSLCSSSPAVNVNVGLIKFAKFGDASAFRRDVAAPHELARSCASRSCALRGISPRRSGACRPAFASQGAARRRASLEALAGACATLCGRSPHLQPAFCGSTRSAAPRCVQRGEFCWRGRVRSSLNNLLHRRCSRRSGLRAAWHWRAPGPRRTCYRAMMRSAASRLVAADS